MARKREKPSALIFMARQTLDLILPSNSSPLPVASRGALFRAPRREARLEFRVKTVQAIRVRRVAFPPARRVALRSALGAAVPLTCDAWVGSAPIVRACFRTALDRTETVNSCPA